MTQLTAPMMELDTSDVRCQLWMMELDTRDMRYQLRSRWSLTQLTYAVQCAVPRGYVPPACECATREGYKRHVFVGHEWAASDSTQSVDEVADAGRHFHRVHHNGE